MYFKYLTDAGELGVKIFGPIHGGIFVAYVVVKIARRKAREIHPLLWIVAGLFVLYFCITPVKTALGVA